jgi:hypothetical protein
MNWAMPTWMHGKMHAERFLQCSVPSAPVVQCSSQTSVLSTGVCILGTLSFGLRRTPIFTKSWRETHVMLWCGLNWVQHTCLAFHSSVTGQAYHDMLSKWLVPWLQQAGIKDTVVLQLDGAPPHFALNVCVITWTRPFPGGRMEEVEKLHPLPLPGPQEVPIWQHQTMLSGDSSRRESAKCSIAQQKYHGQLSKKPSLTWPQIICAKHLPEHVAEFNCATTKVSIPMVWTLRPSGTYPYQSLKHNRYSVKNKRGGGGTPTSWPPCTYSGTCLCWAYKVSFKPVQLQKVGHLTQYSEL